VGLPEMVIKKQASRYSTKRPLPDSNDLKQRGFVEDTLVGMGGEFGELVFSQGKANSQ